MTNPDLTGVTSPAGAAEALASGPAEALASGVGLLVEEVFPEQAVVPEAGDEVAEALLVAGRELVEAFGIRRLRMDDVARAAGYGRATLYRRFATRDDLVWAVVTREVQQVLLGIDRRIADVEALEDRVVEAFAVTVEQIRGSALLGRLLQIEPDLVLPHLTTRGGSALEVARRLILALLREGQGRGQLEGIDVQVAAEIVVRLAHSMLLSPDGPVDLDDPAAVRRFARQAITGPLFVWNRPPR